jgi:PKHD-type hydroxylase
MDQSTTYIKIPGLLKPEELEQIDSLLANAQFVDGRLTASGAAQQVKNNLQLPKDSEIAQQVGDIVLNAISQSPLIQAAIMPKMVLPPLFSRYTEGMYYGWHVDSPLTGQFPTIRSDVSMTVFLNDPSEYEGGELVIQTEAGNLAYKLNKGDAIIYPTTRLHVVNPVQSGVRKVAVTWMQCAVREANKRELLLQLNTAQQLLYQRNPQAPEYLMLQQVYSNLVRMWTEI